MTDQSRIAGYANRLVAGVDLHDGTIDTRQYVNTGGKKGALTANSDDSAKNFTAYIEDSLFVMPNVALVAGTQFLHATRDRDDNFLSNGDQSGSTEFNLWSPKVGLLWDVDRSWQVFANVSRSAEVPSFGEGVSAPAFLGLPSIPFTQIKAQRATTYEIGTRGQRPDYSWDLAAYRAEIDDELMCFYSAFGNCNVTNADKTVHQGLEIGFGVAIIKSIVATGPSPDKLWLQTAYTLNDFHFDDDANFGDNELPGAPRHYLRAELLYKHPSGVYFGPNIEWVPEAYYVDSANTVETEAYAIWGAKLGFDNGGPVTAYIEGRNIVGRSLHRQREHHRQSRRNERAVRARHRPCRLRRCAGEMVMAKHARSPVRALPRALVLSLLIWMAPSGAIQTARAGAPDTDKAAILALMRENWDKPDAKLDVDPVVVEAGYAIAGWTQAERGGRALLRKRDGKWAVVLCSGDPLKEATNIAAAGVPPEAAARLAGRLADAERAIPAGRRDLFSRFEGTVTMEDHSKHH